VESIILRGKGVGQQWSIYSPCGGRGHNRKSDLLKGRGDSRKSDLLRGRGHSRKFSLLRGDVGIEWCRFMVFMWLYFYLGSYDNFDYSC
jgi:hypothetical protein